jgi:hypothetical protein
VNKDSVELGLQIELHVFNLAKLHEQVQRQLGAAYVFKRVVNELLKSSFQVTDLLLEGVVIRVIFLIFFGKRTI